MNDEHHQARQRGLRLAAKITGISITLLGLASAHAASASTKEPAAKEHVPQGMQAGGGSCGCGPCWGPPAPPAEGFARGLA
jgi:hypothetical protein